MCLVHEPPTIYPVAAFAIEHIAQAIRYTCGSQEKSNNYILPLHFVPATTSQPATLQVQS